MVIGTNDILCGSVIRDKLFLLSPNLMIGGTFVSVILSSGNHGKNCYLFLEACMTLEKEKINKTSTLKVLIEHDSLAF